MKYIDIIIGWAFGITNYFISIYYLNIFTMVVIPTVQLGTKRE